MRFISYFSELDVDLSKISHLKTKEFSGFSVIEYDDTMHKEVFELIYDAWKDKPSRDCFGFMAYGEDRNAYAVYEDKFQKCFRCLWLQWPVIQSFFGNKKIKKYESNREKELEKYSSTCSAERVSLTPYKNCRYYDKENKLWFSYRLRECDSKNAPIVVYLHGNGSNGTDNRKQLGEFRSCVKSVASKDCSIIIPQAPLTCRNYDWEPVYLESVKSLIDSVAEKTGADKNRIYLMGGSRGGNNTWELAWKYPDYFACAIPVAGWFFGASKTGECDLERMKSLPLWIFHSEDDTNIAIDSDDFCFEKLRELGSPVLYARLTDAGHSCDKMLETENWLEWMFEQNLKKR